VAYETLEDNFQSPGLSKCAMDQGKRTNLSDFHQSNRKFLHSFCRIFASIYPMPEIEIWKTRGSDLQISANHVFKKKFQKKFQKKISKNFKKKISIFCWKLKKLVPYETYRVGSEKPRT
jgi:hypothetical protein